MPPEASICAIAVTLVLCGCSADAALTRAGMRIERDPFSSSIMVAGPPAGINPLGGTSGTWFLKSRVDQKTHAAATQLIVDINYVGGWRWYGTAADSSASALTLVQAGMRVDECFGAGVCARHEIVAVALDGGKLRTCVLDGYAIRVGAKSGESFTLTVAPAQIHAQLAALAKLEALPAAPTRQAPAQCSSPSPDVS
jgi:hypothetical protein